MNTEQPKPTTNDTAIDDIAQAQIKEATAMEQQEQDALEAICGENTPYYNAFERSTAFLVGRLYQRMEENEHDLEALLSHVGMPGGLDDKAQKIRDLAIEIKTCGENLDMYDPHGSVTEQLDRADRLVALILGEPVKSEPVTEGQN